jgi:hypothetical protein
MLQLKPGDYIVKADGTPCEVRSLRWQLTENGEAAIAVLRTFTESIGVETIFLHIDTVEGEAPENLLVADYRGFFAKDVTMAAPDTVLKIQDQLSRQREMMKVMITEQVHMPSMGKAGAGSTRGHAGQLERAKQKRAAAKEAMELTLLALMEKHSCGRQEAKDLLEKMAGL